MLRKKTTLKAGPAPKSPELEQFKDLLAGFSRIPNKKTPKTILEISRFPHSELACSNLLAFFLDPNEEHGLGDLFLRTLLHARKSKFAGTEVPGVKIQREVRTESNKSLDIIIIGEGVFVIGIENKIYASLRNPLKDYAQKLRRIAQENGIEKESIERIILCLQDETCREYGFTPLTYEQWFKVLLEQTSNVLLTADLRYVNYLTDFMTTIRNLKRGIAMDDETLTFFRQNREQTARLNLKMQELRKMLDGQTDRMAQSVQLPKGIRVKRYGEGEPYDYGSDERCLYFWSVVYCEIEVERDLTLKLEACLYLRDSEENCWDVYISATGKNSSLTGTWLRQNRVRVRSKDDVFMYEQFSFNENPEAVAAKYQELIWAIWKKSR